MATNNTQGTLSSMVPQGTPAAPAQTPPSFGAKLLGNKEFSVELNDAVFETEAWKGSRYNGHQLEATEVNKYNKGDKTYAKTPVLERYSRNIYIGNRIIGFEDNPIDDDPSPCFIKKSYTTVNGYFTINSDDTVTEVGTSFNTDAEQQGFERSFREDFKIGSKASIILLDKGIEHNLKKTYTVDYNEGLLSRIYEYSSSINETSNIIQFRARKTVSNSSGKTLGLNISTNFIPDTLNDNAVITVYSNDQSKYFVDVSGSGTNAPISTFNPFIQDTKTEYNKDLSSNKIFIEFKTTENSPYSYNTFSHGLNSVNVFEIDINNSVTTNVFGNSFTFRLKAKNDFSNPLAISTQQDDGQITLTDHFVVAGDINDINTPANNVIFYKLNRIPSLLINLPKEEELPDGIGENGFIIIPENLDPKIKFNLSSILKSQLGIEVETGYAINGDVSPFDKNN